jgi:hypothetical protein
MFVTFFNGEPATTIPEGAQEITAANATQKASSSLTNTDKAVNKKTDTKDMSMFDEENIDKKFDKAFFDEVARFGMERKNKEISAKTTQAEVPSYKIDQELSDFSDALDYKLTGDMESSMLSKSLDEAAAPAMEPAAPAAEPTAPAPEMAAPVEPPPEMAKGGLVRRRKK